jgi:methyl-accepting chemotaxis protein
MRIWRRSIQWQLIASMGAALLASILVVVAIYTVAVNRLTERLPGRHGAAGQHRGDPQRHRTHARPTLQAADIAGNTLLRDWLAAGEDPAQAPLHRIPGGRQAAQPGLHHDVRRHCEQPLLQRERPDRTLSRANPKDSWFYGYIDSGAERLVNIDIDGATGELALFRRLSSGKGWPVGGRGGMGLRMSELSADPRLQLR